MAGEAFVGRAAQRPEVKRRGQPAKTCEDRNLSVRISLLHEFGTASDPLATRE